MAAATQPVALPGGPETLSMKHLKVDLNPLTGVSYTPRFYKLLEMRQRLPAWRARETFLHHLQQNQVVVLVGEVGSGKGTQLPQILLDAGYHVQGGVIKAVACVQPSDVAAVCASQRVADELEVQLGTHIGYQTRFEDRSSPETLLRVMSSDAFVQELATDTRLERYSAILVDEAQEREAFTDVLLSLFPRVLRQRAELKLVVMATSSLEEARRFQVHFAGAPLVRVPCQRELVETLYLQRPEKDYLYAAVRAVLEIHVSELDGDVLVFVCSDEEIESTCAILRKQCAAFSPARPDLGELHVVPLYETLPQAQLSEAFCAAPFVAAAGSRAPRRVVVATSFAESSVALNDIVYVVDTGFRRQRLHNPRVCRTENVTAPLCKANAERRAAHAGRVRSGKCLRLYTEASFKQLPETFEPELVRGKLSRVVLALKAMGIDNICQFEFLEPPPPEVLMLSLLTLHWLGCIDDSGGLTEAGIMSSRFAVEPQVAKMLLEASRHKCCNEALSIAAMLNVESVFLRPSGSGKAADEARNLFAHLDGDHLTLLNVFHAFKQHAQDPAAAALLCSDNFINIRALRTADVVREKLRWTMEALQLPTVSTDFQDKEYYPNIRRCLLAGFFMQVARLVRERTGTYCTMRENEEARLHPFTSLKARPEWVIYDDFALGSRGHLRTVTQIQGSWLFEVVPHYFDMEKWPTKETRAHLEKLSESASAPPG